MLLISSCKKWFKTSFRCVFATIRLLLDKQNGITESGQLNTKSFKPYFVCYGEGHVSFKLCCSTLDKKKKKERNIPEVRGEKKTVRSCDILLDHERSAQERSSGDYPRLLPCADRAWSTMISHDGTVFFSPRISGWFFFFVQGSSSTLFNTKNCLGQLIAHDIRAMCCALLDCVMLTSFSFSPTWPKRKFEKENFCRRAFMEW